MQFAGHTPVMTLRASLWYNARWPGQCSNALEVGALLNQQVPSPRTSLGR